MTKEGKQLLLKDLCARLNCGVEVYAQYEPTGEWYNGRLVGIDLEDEPCFTVQFYKPVPYTNYCNKKEIKPYLRPMSSMTEEERKEYKHLVAFSGSSYGAADLVDWLNKKMFSYRTIDGKDMFELGLALVAKE